MVYEDFTIFTEVDIAADRIQKTANHIDHVALRNETTYLYKDYGVNQFGNFTHKIKVRFTYSANSSWAEVWVLANDLGNSHALCGANKSLIFVFFFTNTSGQHSIYLRECNGGLTYSDYYQGVSLNTWYYIKIVKSGTSLTAYIYGDADYSTLIDTLSVTLQSDYSFRYLYGCNTRNDGSNYTKITEIENFDLGELHKRQISHGYIFG